MDIYKGFKILSCEDNWGDYINRFKFLDIYYSYEYTKMFSEIQDGVPHAAYFECNDGMVYYPFIKRNIPFMEGYFDTITPYGYGGPIVEGSSHIITKFYKKFHRYCLENNIVTETVGFHPLLNNQNLVKGIMRTDFIRNTAFVDLRPSLEEIRKEYSSSNRRNIRRGLKNGVQTMISDKKEDLAAFIKIYYETMERKEASKFYFFAENYFYRQMEATPLCKSILIVAKYQGEIIGGVILLAGKQFAHYHLGASKAEYLQLKTNNVLFDAMVEAAKSLGATVLHLGGGYINDDSLFRFKASFTKQAPVKYYLGKNIINPKVYVELCKLNDVKGSEKEFFPSYRSS